MFPNEVLMNPQTWNDILAAMVAVRDAHGWSYGESQQAPAAARATQVGGKSPKPVLKTKAKTVKKVAKKLSKKAALQLKPKAKKTAKKATAKTKLKTKKPIRKRIAHKGKKK